MNRHKWYEESIAVYRDLTGEERARVDAHLAGCPACAQRLAAFQRVDGVLSELKPVRTPPALMRPLTSVLTHRRPVRHGAGSPGIIQRSFAPGFLALLVIGGLWLALASSGSRGAVATSTPTLTLTPTATLMSQSWNGHHEIAYALTAGDGPEPRPVPAPPQTAPGPETGGGVFLVTHFPRATIVR